MFTVWAQKYRATITGLVTGPAGAVIPNAAITMLVSGRVRVDMQLDRGQLTERVTITAEAPLLETSTGSRGQVADSKIELKGQPGELRHRQRLHTELIEVVVGRQ